MISSTLAQQLHDKSTRGGTLTVGEQQQLEDWYVSQDLEEQQILGISEHPEDTILHLRKQIDVALDQLTLMTAHIHTVTSENEGLRREIGRLRHQLTNKTAKIAV